MSRVSKYSDEQLIIAVASSKSIAEVLRSIKAKQAGGTHRHIKMRIERLGLDTSHFLGLGIRKNMAPATKKAAKDILILDESKFQRAKSYQLKRALLEIGRKEICQECGKLPWWNDKPLVLQIDHIDGNWKDHREHNLRFLCPDCHSQTETWRNRSKQAPSDSQWDH